MIYDVFNDIETIDFEADLAIASGSTLFMLILENHTLIQKLIQKLRKDTKMKNVLMDRIFTLLNTEVKPDYNHPYDSAISAYLYVLNKLDSLQAFKVSEQVLNTDQMYWAHLFAKGIREDFGKDRNVS